MTVHVSVRSMLGMARAQRDVMAPLFMSHDVELNFRIQRWMTNKVGFLSCLFELQLIIKLCLMALEEAMEMENPSYFMTSRLYIGVFVELGDFCWLDWMWSPSS